MSPTRRAGWSILLAIVIVTSLAIAAHARAVGSASPHVGSPAPLADEPRSSALFPTQATPPDGPVFTSQNFSLGPPGFLPTGTVFVNATSQDFTPVLPDLVVITDPFNGTILHRITVSAMQPSSPYLFDPFGSFVQSPILYDPALPAVLVGDFQSDALSVINTTTDRVVNTVDLGAAPISMAFDSANEEVFVMVQYANGSAAIFTVNGTALSLAVEGTLWLDGISFLPGTSAIVVDAVDHIVYFTGRPSPGAGVPGFYGFLGWFQTSSPALNEANVCAGGSPMAFDPDTDEVFLPQGGAECFNSGAGSGSLYIVQGSDQIANGSVNVPDLNGNAAMGFAPDSGDIYVATPSGVFAVDPGTNTRAAPILDGAQCPSGLSLTTPSGPLLISDECGDEVAEVNLTSGISTSVQVAGVGPNAITYDSAADNLVIADQAASGATVWSAAHESIVASYTNKILYASGVAFDPDNSESFIAGWNATVGIVSGSTLTTTQLPFPANPNFEPSLVAIDPTTNYVYVNPGVPDNVTVLEGNSTSTVGSIPFSADDWGLVCCPRQIYV